MAEKTRVQLKSFFETGDTPSELEFQDLIDSCPNYKDDNDRYGRDIAITSFAGGGQANAYILTNAINVVTVCVNVNDSIKLPVGNISRVYTVYNKTGTQCAIYPCVGGEINQLGLNIGHAFASGTILTIVNYDDKKWYLYEV